jgi:hypothetical protein
MGQEMISAATTAGAVHTLEGGRMTALKNPMTMEELLALPVSFGLPVAARALGIGKNMAYEMAAAGALDGEALPCPVRRYRNEYRVTRPDLVRALGLPPDLMAAAPPDLAPAPPA